MTAAPVSATAIATAVRSGALRAETIIDAAIERAERARALNGWITLDADGARAAARMIDARGAGHGALAGVPLAHKDLFVTRGLRTTAASKMLSHFVPPYDAHVVERAAAEGAVTLGKANLDEFAMGSSNETSFFGPVLNPWDRARVPGGSSGGSAALVAAGIVPIATGTDTGGSVRQPAAFCGVTGLKATYGRVSRYGMIAYASSLDQAGVFARSARDAALGLGAIAGHDPRDPTSSPRAVDDYAARLDSGVRGLRVGVVAEYFGSGVDAAVDAQTRLALAALEAAGASLVDISLPELQYAIPAYYAIAPAEASSNLARYDGVRYGHRAAEPRDLESLYTRSRGEGFGAVVKRRILAGTYVLSAGYYDAYYGQAQRARRLIAEAFARAFAEVDVLAGPTAPTVAFALGATAADPLATLAADINTVAVNLAGLPALSVPAGFVTGLPVGLQLIGRAFDEARLLGAAAALESVSEWHRAWPPGFAP